jgi:hypothetical protein
VPCRLAPGISDRCRIRRPELICPTGKFREMLSSPFEKNISVFPKPKSGVWFAPSCTRSRGAFAIVTNVGCGMQWTRSIGRDVQLHARRRAMTFADGEVVWS